MLNVAQNVLLYTIPFLAVLTLVVTVHELGHFLVARMFGVAVDRFSVGFGRALLSWNDKSGTEWRLSWIPIGGYVKFSGDENAASIPDEEYLTELRKHVLAQEGPAALRRYFHFKPLWQRALVIAAGPFANFALAIVIFAGLAWAFGDISLSARVGKVVPNSPAAHAGFQAGDLILNANGHDIRDFQDLTQFVVLRAGEQIRFGVQRAAARLDLTATPARRTESDTVKGAIGGGPVGLGYLGVEASHSRTDIQVVRFGPLGALGQGLRQTGDILGSTLTYLRRIFTGHESGNQFSGVVGIAGVTGQAASAATHDASSPGAAAGLLALTLIKLAAFISVAVGFANLLPIPVLDGGHLLFYGYEAVARRPLAANVQAAGYRVGFALLISLMLFVTWNDLQRFRVLHFIGGLFS